MPRKITVRLSETSIDGAIGQLEDYKKRLADKAQLLCKRLAEIGLKVANSKLDIQALWYVGDVDCDITVEEIKNGYRVLASGETALILEFGAGYMRGFGHPQAEEFGMGPGTYPDGKGHWNDPKGWYLPGGHGRHTYGNTPGMMMYGASKEIRMRVEAIAKEVFQS